MKQFKYRLLPVTILLITAFLQCKDSPKGNALEAPSPDTFKWGESAEKTADELSSQAWDSLPEGRSDRDRMDLYFPSAIPEELRNLDLFADFSNVKPSEPYTVTLHARDGKLAVAQLLRRDTTERLEAWIESFFEKYNLDKPARSFEPIVEKTETGNEIIDQTTIHENDQLFFKMYRSTVRTAEERMRSGLNDQISIQIFSKDQNPELNLERLIESESQQQE